jgi:hypothetical protein
MYIDSGRIELNDLNQVLLVHVDNSKLLFRT